MNKTVQLLTALFKDKQITILLVILTVSALLIVLVNYNTIRTLTAIRAYIQGEGLYSKGEKDASQDLVLYLDTQDEIYLDNFYRNAAIPRGDSLARASLSSDKDVDLAREGFLEGKNHAEDLDNMIWLFLSFQDNSFMQEPIAIWVRADSLIYQKVMIAQDVHASVLQGSLTPEQKSAFLRRIIENSNQLTILERAFTSIMGSIARQASNYLFIFNLTITVVIFLTAMIYVVRIIRRSRKQGDELRVINEELDRFLYSASHDLRAPISSLKGLVALSQMEGDQEVIRKYLDLMMVALEKQDRFIQDIIDFNKNKRIDMRQEEVNLETLIDDVIAQHKYMPGATQIVFEKEIVTEKIWCDLLRVEIIMNNLISNAIKYLDTEKEKNHVRIRTYPVNHSIMIEVEDNGIGITKENLTKVFNMFYVTHHDNKGTGLGLYITKETVSRLGGVIRVDSVHKEMTRFSVQLPVLDRSNI